MFVKARMKTLILSLSIILVLPVSLVQAAGQEPHKPAEAKAEQHVLLLYDSLAKGTSKEGNVEALQRMLASFGVRVTLDSFDTYKQGSLQTYEKVIGVSNVSDVAITNQDYLQDFERYAGDYLHIGANVPGKVQKKLRLQVKQTKRETIEISMDQFTQQSIQVQQMHYIDNAAGKTYGRISSTGNKWQSPFGIMNERYGYVPYYEQGNLSEIAISYLLKDWLQVSGLSHTYVVFKEIYPFSDLMLLEQMADKLYSAGIPFIVSVRPVFSNTDYPAMKRYLETLQYVQSKNGSILVNAPVVASTISQYDRDLKEKMELFIDALANYGIAPLGIGAEMYWSYDQHYAATGMDAFDSAIMFPNERIMYKSPTNTSTAFSSSLYSLQPSFLNQFERSGKAMQPLPMDTALTFDFVDNEQQLTELVEVLNNSWITFSDYKYGVHEVTTHSNRIHSQNGSLYINNQVVDLNKARQTISSEHAYKEKEKKSFETWFNIQNKIFIVIILVTITAFGGFFIIGYRLYKRKYLK